MGDLSLRTLMSAGVRSASGLVLVVGFLVGGKEVKTIHF